MTIHPSNTTFKINVLRVLSLALFWIVWPNESLQFWEQTFLFQMVNLEMHETTILSDSV